MQFNFKICHILITRPRSGTSIDNVFCNIETYLKIIPVEWTLSEHYLLNIIINVNLQSFMEHKKELLKKEEK